MNVDMHHAVTALVATTGSWWGRLSDNWKALLVIGAAVALGWTGSQMKEDIIGRGSHIAANRESLDSLDSRVDVIQGWIDFHTAEESQPGLSAIERLEQRDSLLQMQVDTIVRRQERMYCGLFPEECPPRLRRPGNGGGR